MIRRGSLFLLTCGVLIGIVLLPLLAIISTQGSQSAHAQSVPFTPTLEPTDTPTATPEPPTVTPTAVPSATPQVVVVVATPTLLPATALPSATPNPPGFGRDQCTPNGTLEQPCALATETDVPNLNFNDGPIDVYSFVLKGGRQYRISATIGAQGGLDPSMELFLAGTTAQALATNDDDKIGNPSSVITVTVQADGWYLARVTNKAPGATQGKVYTMSARSVGVAGAAPAAPNHPDDLIGNAYDADHAVRLAWGVPYDLSMLCPDPRPGACYAGRHTFLLVPVKGGVPFTAVTYDLGAGVDTVLTLYKPAPSHTDSGPGQVPGWEVVASNDDVAAGWTLRSQVHLTPDWNSLALLVVAPSDRQDMPSIPADGRPGRYRLIVGSPDLPPLKAVLGGQQDMPPTPPPATARPTGQAAPAAVSTQPALDTREVIKESCPTGTAEVGAGGTNLYAAAPPAADDKIADYPEGALIQLLGQCYRGWVKVQPADSVTPGWMWGPNLRPDELSAFPTRTGATGQSTTPAAGTPAANVPASAATTPPRATPAPMTQARPLTLTPLAPLPAPTAVAALPAARALTITACYADPAQAGTCAKRIAGVRVDLLLAATNEVRVSGVTDDEGRVTLSTSVATGTRLLLQISAFGLQAPLDANQSEITVRLPQGDAK